MKRLETARPLTILVLAAAISTAGAVMWRGALDDRGAIAFFMAASAVVTIRCGVGWGLLEALTTSLVWDYFFLGPTFAFDDHLFPILGVRVLCVLGLWALIGRPRRVALNHVIDDPEERVLREAVEDMAGWITELPETSEWRYAFLTARAQVASAAGQRHVSLVQTHQADPRS